MSPRAIAQLLLFLLLTGCGGHEESKARADKQADEAAKATGSTSTADDESIAPAEAGQATSPDDALAGLDALIGGLDPDAPPPKPWPLEPAPEGWRDSRPPTIPLVQGLTAVVAVQEPRGDYESAGRVLSVETDHVVLSYSLKSGSVSGVKSMRARRTVLTKDLLNARVYRMTYSAADPEAFPGSTSLGVSNAIYRELQDPGRSKIDLFAGVDAVGAMLAAADALPSDLTGELVRASEEPVGVPVLVNGKRVWLPAVYVKGDFEGMIRSVPVELWLLADEKNPLTLRAHVDKAQIQMVRIDFPDVPAKSAIETALAEKRPLEMWGVYFEFASAALEPESASVLDEVAGVLRGHPDWRVRIEGHTDNVGNDAHNLELSKLRAEAVRAALASRLGNGAAVVDAAGYGESRPRESNDTLAGRARNRRVEMLRQ